MKDGNDRVETLFYPRKVEPSEVYTQKTLDRLTSLLLSWKQGPGNFGALHLHSCWGTTSVLTRRYHGQSTFMSYWLMRGAKKLYERTKERRWQRLAEEIVLNVIHLQADNGGFIHARAEHEPGYTAFRTCPIHQSLPVIALLEYAEWPYADEKYHDDIRETVDRHWDYMQKVLWKSGNGYQRPLDFPGWCGVANQDLVTIASLALYARVFGDDSRFASVGMDSLNVYLSGRYCYPEIGLMERGDAPNLTERTVYYDIVLSMLDLIYDYCRDSRVAQAMDNIALHLFDTLYEGDDGLLHMSWGAQTDPLDKTRVLDWIRTPVTMSGYPGLIEQLERYVRRRPDERKAQQVAQLKKTLASYVFADGTFPGALRTEDPIFQLVSSPNSGVLHFWLSLIDELGEGLRPPVIRPLPCIHRKAGGLVWKTNQRLWSIERGGERLYAGWKINPHGVVHGAETFDDISLDELQSCDIVEIVEA